MKRRRPARDAFADHRARIELRRDARRLPVPPRAPARSSAVSLGRRKLHARGRIEKQGSFCSAISASGRRLQRRFVWIDEKTRSASARFCNFSSSPLAAAERAEGMHALRRHRRSPDRAAARPALVPYAACSATDLRGRFAPARPRRRMHRSSSIQPSMRPKRQARCRSRRHTKTIVDWARQHGPFDGLGVAVADADRRAGRVRDQAARGHGAGTERRRRASSCRATRRRWRSSSTTGAQPYFDALRRRRGERGRDRGVARREAIRRRRSSPSCRRNRRTCSSTSRARSPTARRAPTRAAGDAEPAQRSRSFDRALTGDYAYDSTASIDDARRERQQDRRCRCSRSCAAKTCARHRAARRRGGVDDRLAGRRPTTVKPRRIDAAGERDITDAGTKGGALPHRHAAGEAAVRLHRRARREAARERDEGSDRTSPRSAASRSRRSSAITRRTSRTRNRSSRATSRTTPRSCASR